jgi:hypothetical protein
MPFAPFAPPLPRPLPLHVKVREGVKATAIDQAGTCTALTMETQTQVHAHPGSYVHGADSAAVPV